MLQSNMAKMVNHHAITRTLKKNSFSPMQFAVYAAYQRFQQAHPEWVTSLFDETFLRKEVAIFFAGDRLPTPMQLATAWRNQFGFGTEAQRAAHIQRILPAVTAFLRMVCQELDLYQTSKHYGENQ